MPFSRYHHLSSPSSTCVLFLLFTLLLIVPWVEGISMELTPGEVLCLQEPVPLQSSVTLQFQVQSVASNEDGINVVLTDQDGRGIKSWERVTDGKFDAHARDGVRLLNACFASTNAIYGSQWLDFHFRYHVDYTTVAKLSELDPIERRVEAIARNMQTAEELQMYLRNLQKEHRNTVEDTNERLLMWTVFQVVSLIGMSLFQLYFLRRFLERKSFV